MPGSAEMTSLLDDNEFLLELEKLETGTPRPQPVSRPPFWNANPQGAAQERFEALPEADDDAEADAAGLETVYAAAETSAPKLAPIGAYRNGEPVRASSQTVSTRLVAMVVVCGICAGAGGAVVVFRDQVQQIVTLWTAGGR